MARIEEPEIPAVPIVTRDRDGRIAILGQDTTVWLTDEEARRLPERLALVLAEERVNPMEGWEARLVLERTELSEKLEKLTEFLSSGRAHGVTGKDGYGLLIAQEALMVAYLGILDRRIALA